MWYELNTPSSRGSMDMELGSDDDDDGGEGDDGSKISESGVLYL